MSIDLIEGGCTCGEVRYKLTHSPLFVHCCHCSWCQRETGTAFALNALIESEHVVVVGRAPEKVKTPSASGKGQTILRCPTCRIAVWSHYPESGDKLSFVRVGTLDQPNKMPPDIHIYTSSKQPWIILSGEIPSVPEYYHLEDYWPAASALRFAELEHPG